jgi:hypothetical protein
MLNSIIQTIHHTIKSILDPFRYNNLEDRDAPTNFSLIDSIKNNTGTHIVAFPGPYWFFPPMLPEMCTVCF